MLFYYDALNVLDGDKLDQRSRSQVKSEITDVKKKIYNLTYLGFFTHRLHTSY